LEEYKIHASKAVEEAKDVYIQMENAAFSWGYRIKENIKGG